MGENGNELAETTAARLQTGYLLLRTIQILRAENNMPGYGWAVERAIVNRELSELEEDLRLNPPFPGRRQAAVRRTAASVSGRPWRR
jgi:hypothetical protein